MMVTNILGMAGSAFMISQLGALIVATFSCLDCQLILNLPLIHSAIILIGLQPTLFLPTGALLFHING